MEAKREINYFESVLIPALALVLFSFLLGTLYIVGPMIFGYLYFFEIYDDENAKFSRLWALIFLIAGQVVLGVVTSMFKAIDELVIVLAIHMAIFVVFFVLGNYRKKL